MEQKELEIIMEMKGDIEGIKSLLSTMVNTNNTSIEALQSARSAHHRIDKIDKIIFWAGTTIVGAIILAFLAFMVKGGLVE